MVSGRYLPDTAGSEAPEQTFPFERATARWFLLSLGVSNRPLALSSTACQAIG